MNTEEIKDVNIITTKNNKELEKRLKELSQELIEENYELYRDLENYWFRYIFMIYIRKARYVPNLSYYRFNSEYVALFF